MAARLQLTDVLASLESGKGTLSWADRRALAAELGGALVKPDLQEPALRIAQLLANDPKWEVRKEIASLLPTFADDVFNSLAARLSDDPNGFVRKTAERAIDLRQRGLRDAGHRRKGLDHIIAQFDLLGTGGGPGAGEKTRALAVRLFEVSVGAVVHDLRGVLTSVCSQVSRLRVEAEKPTPDGTVLNNGLGRVASRLAYLEKFVEAMDAYSQPIPTLRKTARLGDLVQEAHGMALDAIHASDLKSSGVEPSISVDDHITVVVTPHQIVTAIANVIKNAYESMLLGTGAEKGGRLMISAERGIEDEVRVTIQDTGGGITADDLRELRAFIPGRTMKQGYGTGFGLAIAQRYVAAHGGSISLASTQDVGTTVTIIFPSESPQGMSNEAEGSSGRR